MQTVTRPDRERGRSRWFGYLAVGVLAAVALALTGFALARPSGPAESTQGETITPVVIPRTTFIGDSYTQGAGASSPSARWVTRLSVAKGWEPENLGRGGTGYVTSAGPAACGLEYCATYQEVVDQVVEAAPNIVVVAGGVSDFAAFDDDAAPVVTAISATFTSLRSGLPEAEIIAVGPYSPQNQGATAAAFDLAVAQAATAAGARFVSLLNPPLVDTAFVLPDGVQLSDAGHAAIAQRIEQSLEQ